MMAEQLKIIHQGRNLEENPQFIPLIFYDSLFFQPRLSLDVSYKASNTSTVHLGYCFVGHLSHTQRDNIVNKNTLTSLQKCTLSHHVVFKNSFTWQPVDEPAELFLRDVGPAEVQSYWLSPDDAAQHERCDGFATVQIDVLPKPLVTAPGETHNRHCQRAAAW